MQGLPANNTHNRTAQLPYQPGYEEFMTRVYLVLIALCSLAIVLNIYILVGTAWLRARRSPHVRLCISLCAADTFAATAHVTLMLILVSGALRSVCLMLSLLLLLWASTANCVLHVLAIAAAQLLGVWFPLQSRYWLSGKVTGALTALMWTLPAAGYVLGVLVYQMLAHEHFCHFSAYQHVNFRAMQTSLLVPAFVAVCFTYWYMLRLIEHRDKLTEDARAASTWQHKRHGVVTAVLIALSLGVGYLPITVVNHLICPFGCLIDYSYIVAHPQIIYAVTTSTYVLTLVKLSANAFIYVSRIPAIRESLGRMHAFVLRRPDPSWQVGGRSWNSSRRFTERQTSPHRHEQREPCLPFNAFPLADVHLTSLTVTPVLCNEHALVSDSNAL